MKHHSLVGALAASALAVAGCTATTYQGLDLQRGALTDNVRHLAVRARAGDKRAQLELGDRFSVGNGVPRDLGRARALYSDAARSSGGTLWIYSPPVGKEGQGRVIPVQTRVVTGLPAAAARLAAMSELPN